MSRFIDADALLEDWGIDIEPIKRRPIQMDEFRDFMRRYENHPYYFAILAIALATTADVVGGLDARIASTTGLQKQPDTGDQKQKCVQEVLSSR